MIDNGDGLGAVDYTGSMAMEEPLTIRRGLNVPSRCVVALQCETVAVPARLARLVVSSDTGVLLFTGYLATEPMQVYVGTASAGPVYRTHVEAISDEWLLDRAGAGVAVNGNTAVQTDATSALQAMTARVPDGATGFSVEHTSMPPRVLGAVTLNPSRSWSENARTLAAAAYASYRGLNAAVYFTSAAVTTHEISDADGSLQPAQLQLTAARELANDVTLSGEEEPAAYVSESFAGDGTTATFTLRDAAFRSKAPTLIDDSFLGAEIDSTVWSVSDPAGALSLSSAGLAFAGGSGGDGQTFLRGIDAVELGGAVVAELGGVVLNAGSTGMLAGFYGGVPLEANCVAGFHVRQSGGSTLLAPWVSGAEAGIVFTPSSGHRYTLRVRLYCVEMLRVGQPYYCLVDGVLQQFGSAAALDAPLRMCFEVVDEGASSNTPATVLYDSAAAGVTCNGLAGVCSFLAVNAQQMFGNVGSVRVTRPGSLWVVSTLPNGAQQTRLMGSAGQGADCEVAFGSSTGATGHVSFFTGRVPAAGERVTVLYRTSRRAVARLADEASITAEARGGASGVSRWIGKAVQPPARSTTDCERAAEALLAFATSRSAALAGSYTMANPAADVWPGDLLQITNAALAEGATTPLLVRSVTVQDGHAVPELLQYRIAFANDWATELADGLGLTLSDAVASDALLPAFAASGPGEVLANLQQLTATSVSTTTLTIDAGCDPPVGGGFEVRRRDWSFGEAVDPADLVLRSPVRNFSLPRAAQSEQFYVRMYDAGVPRLYSRFSSAVFVNAPVG